MVHKVSGEQVAAFMAQVEREKKKTGTQQTETQPQTQPQTQTQTQTQSHVQTQMQTQAQTQTPATSASTRGRSRSRKKGTGKQTDIDTDTDTDQETQAKTDKSRSRSRKQKDTEKDKETDKKDTENEPSLSEVAGFCFNSARKICWHCAQHRAGSAQAYTWEIVACCSVIHAFQAHVEEKQGLRWLPLIFLPEDTVNDRWNARDVNNS